MPAQSDCVGSGPRHTRCHSLRPGIAGPASVLGVDVSDPERLARLDESWLTERSFHAYLGLMALTAGGRGRGDQVRSN
jgi:O-antigen biosynthesis protein WbqP